MLPLTPAIAVNCMAFNHNGNLLVTGGVDGMIRLFGKELGRERFQLLLLRITLCVYLFASISFFRNLSSCPFLVLLDFSDFASLLYFFCLYLPYSYPSLFPLSSSPPSL